MKKNITTHFHNHKTEYVPFVKEVNIQEHRAPTDESIKLLNEMQEKAVRNIIQTVKVDENHLKAVVIFFQDDVIHRKINYTLKFTLNGEEYIMSGEFSNNQINEFHEISYYQEGISLVFEAMHKMYSELIATEFLNVSQNFMKSLKQF